MPLNDRQRQLCDRKDTDYSDLKTVIFNCSLKKQPRESHTRLLLSVVITTCW